MGWAEQIDEGSDLAYCSKTTVAEWCGLGESTVYRATKRLVAVGVMVPTGEFKVWTKECVTPVYRLDVQKIADLIKTGVQNEPPETKDVVNLNGGSQCTGVQNDIQGSGRFSVKGSSSSSLSFIEKGNGNGSSCTDLRSVNEAAAPPPSKSGKEEREPQTLEPRTENQNRPQLGKEPLGKKRELCPWGCGAELVRDENHMLVCSMLNKPTGEASSSKALAKAKPESSTVPPPAKRRILCDGCGMFHPLPLCNPKPVVEKDQCDEFGHCEGCFNNVGEEHHKNCHTVYPSEPQPCVGGSSLPDLREIGVEDL
jgi:hypothetical protein